MIQASTETNEIATACAKAQLAMVGAVKDSTNPAFRSKYADLSAIIEAAKVYAQHGVAIFQDAELTDGGVAVSTRLVHSSGQWMEFGPLTIPLTKRDAHGVGSAVTYAKRYGLSAAGLVPSEDDDGNAATNGAPKVPIKALAPQGYADWLLDFEATAAGGIDALTAAFKAAPESFRAHYAATVPQKDREALKAHAKAVNVPQEAP